jgi:hypothetical protein
VRLEEMHDGLGGLVAEPQRQWERIPIEHREGVLRARAHMVEMRLRLEARKYPYATRRSAGNSR